MSNLKSCLKCGLEDSGKDDFPVVVESSTGGAWCKWHDPVSNLAWEVAKEYPCHIETTEDLAEVIERSLRRYVKGAEIVAAFGLGEE